VSESVRKLIWRVILHGMLLYEILSKLRLGAIINTSSGGCDLESEQKMLNIFKAAGIVEPKMWCGGAGQMERAFAEAFGQKLEVLVVLGGDGTIRTAAERCADEGRYIIPLPGGTMNMLPRALYGDVSWDDALKNTLAAPSAKVISGGRVADKQFFVAAVVGRRSCGQKPENLYAKEILLMLSKRGVSLSRTCLKPRCSI
jgi:diacylglycerol kinase family enzyme